MYLYLKADEVTTLSMITRSRGSHSSAKLEMATKTQLHGVDVVRLLQISLRGLQSLLVGELEPASQPGKPLMITASSVWQAIARRQLGIRQLCADTNIRIVDLERSEIEMLVRALSPSPLQTKLRQTLVRDELTVAEAAAILDWNPGRVTRLADVNAGKTTMGEINRIAFGLQLLTPRHRIA